MQQREKESERRKKNDHMKCIYLVRSFCPNGIPASSWIEHAVVLRFFSLRRLAFRCSSFAARIFFTFDFVAHANIDIIFLLVTLGKYLQHSKRKMWKKNNNWIHFIDWNLFLIYICISPDHRNQNVCAFRSFNHFYQYLCVSEKNATTTLNISASQLIFT